MSARHRQSKKRTLDLVELGDLAASNLSYSLATAGALCAAFWMGWFARSCDATPGSFTCDEYWTPGCGRESKVAP